MKIANQAVVSIEYTVSDEDGTLIDSSEDSGPMAYIQGTGAIIPGLEAKLEGKEKGAHFELVVGPEDGYGVRDEELVESFPKRQFEDPELLEVGMQFELESEDGPTVVSIVGLDNDEVVVDGNHPLAGLTLKFVVTVIEVRKATKEELQHGHAHGPDGHHH